MISRDKSLAVAGLGFLWLAGIVVIYYVSHKPFSPSLALNLAQSMWQICLAVVLLALAGGTGRRFLSCPDLHPLARPSLQAALGLGVMSLAILILGVFGWLRPLVGWGALLALLVALRRDVMRWGRDWGAVPTLWKDTGRLGRTIGIGVALILFFTLIIALAPPVKFDALSYHLAFPHIYLSAGRIVYTPHMHWGMPQAGEMLYAWAIMLAGDQAAVVLGWGFGVLTLAGLLGYVAQRLGGRAAWVSVASLLSGFSLASALSWAYVDWLIMLYGLAFLATLDLWTQTLHRRALLLTGVFAGMALSVKYTAGVLLLCGLVAILWHSRKRLERSSLIAALFQFALVAGLVVSPWLIKNVLATGNPVYPFLFPAGAMDQLRLDILQGGEPWGGWQDVVFLPLRATFFGLEGAPGYGASIGPLLVGLAVLAWLGWPSLSRTHRATVTHAALVVLPSLLIWAILGRFSSYLLQSRLYFAIFPALSVLAGAGFVNLSRYTIPGVRLGRIAGFVVVFVLALNGFELGVDAIRRGAAQAVLGLRSPEAYLGDNLGWYAPAMKALCELDDGAHVLMLLEPRSLHCLPVCEPDEILDRWLRDLYGSARASPRSSAEILASWRQAGYTHLLFYQLGAEFMRSENLNYSEAEWRALYALLEQLTALQDFGDTYILYRLDP